MAHARGAVQRGPTRGDKQRLVAVYFLKLYKP
jgi:hypothetical protein